MKWTGIFLLVFIFLMACSPNQIEEKDKSAYHDQEVKDYETFATDAKELLQANDSITTIETLASEDNLLIGFKVKSLQNLKLNSIKKDFKEHLTEHFPMHHITLSTDQKIIIEMRRLAEKKHRLTAVQYARALQKIIALEKEET